MAEEGVRILEFLDWFTLLVGFVVVLAVGLLPFIGIGLGTYYVLRGRVSRWALRGLVIGIPFAVAVAYALIIGGMVIYVNAISE